MKRIAAVAVLALCLAAPLSAAPRDDDSPRSLNPIARIVHFIAHVLDDTNMSLPRP